jgi:hypothetical protein
MEKLSQMFKKVAFDGIVPVCHKLFGHGERYIKADGSKFHSKPLKSFFEKAAFKAYAITTTAVVGGDFLLNGQYDGDPTSLSILLSVGAFSLFQSSIIDNILLENPTLKGKSIDTEGRNFPRKMLSLKNIQSLDDITDRELHYSKIYTAIGVIGLITTQDPAFLMITSAIMVGSINRAYIHNMLLKGHAQDLEFEDDVDAQNIKKRKKENGYVICDEPPRKTVKEKKSLLSLGGLTNPAP